MGQKADDTLVIPLCRVHHAEQHRIGWPTFIRTYELDVQAILAELRERPRLFIVRNALAGWRWHPRGCARTPDVVTCYCARYRDTEFVLRNVRLGLPASLDLAFRVCGEYLRDQWIEQRRKVA